MTNEEIKLKIQALVDNEISEQEIPEVLSLIESSYEFRDEYVRLLRFQRKMRGITEPEPPKEWFEELSKRAGRKVTASIGQFLFFGSYLLLIGYALYTLFSDNGEGLFIKLIVAGIFVGLLSLLGVTIGDRVRESRTDRYKGVTK